MNTIKEYSDHIKEIKNKLKDNGATAFYNELKPIFDKYPDIESIGWVQYTPYFNDGDVCEFYTHIDEGSIYINDIHQWSSELSSINSHKHDFGDSSIEREIVKKLNCIEEEIFLIAFGDHVKVTIYRNGKSETDTYEHD